MLWSKMQCAQCEHYRSCPSSTRMFINYCGSRKERIAGAIRSAVSDCKSRRSFILKYRRPTLLSLSRSVRVEV